MKRCLICGLLTCDTLIMCHNCYNHFSKIKTIRLVKWLLCVLLIIRFLIPLYSVIADYLDDHLIKESNYEEQLLDIEQVIEFEQNISHITVYMSALLNVFTGSDIKYLKCVQKRLDSSPK